MKRTNEGRGGKTNDQLCISHRYRNGFLSLLFIQFILLILSKEGFFTKAHIMTMYGTKAEE